MKIYNSYQELAAGQSQIDNALDAQQRANAIQDVSKAGDLVFKSARSYQSNGEPEAGRVLYGLEDQINKVQKHLMETETQVSNSFSELQYLGHLNCHDVQDMKKLHDSFVEIAGHAANYGFMLAETAAHEAAESIKRSFGDEWQDTDE